MSKIMQSKHFKYIVLALLFLGWCLGNLDRFVINYAIVGITEDLGLALPRKESFSAAFSSGMPLCKSRAEHSPTVLATVRSFLFPCSPGPYSPF